MADDTTHTGGSDRTRINVHQDHELRHWAKKFDCTTDQLREAVLAVGTQAADVEMHLKGTHATTNADAAARAEALAPEAGSPGRG